MDLLKAVLTVFSLIAGHSLPEVQSKVCYGTSNGLSEQGHAQDRYTTLRQIYENCTYVDGNMEIVYLREEDNYDLAFLKDVEVITGYLLIYQVNAKVIPMTNLRVIRGDTLFKPHRYTSNNYSLFVMENPGSNVGLKQLQFYSLREIIHGDINIALNRDLCNVDTIYWRDIVGEADRVIIVHPDLAGRKKCSPCHSSCSTFEGSKYCWGPLEHECQKLVRVTCAPQCASLCFDSLPNACCHAECQGGCTGPRRSDCWVCRNFRNEGECVPFCPPATIYDTTKFENVPNPNAKFSHGNICVNSCPSHLVEEAGACVKECSQGKHPINNTCVTCGDVCPKTCPGFKNEIYFLSSKNIENFRNCTIIEGNLQILQLSFKGVGEIPGITPSDLSIFNQVHEITGSLTLQFIHPEVPDASFLSNLETIHGRILLGGQYSLSLIRTGFKSIGLKSLRRIMNGNISLSENPDLCYTENTNYTLLLRHPSQQKVHITGSRASDQCERDGYVCDGECSQGCWGPGPDQCLRCRNYELDKVCVGTCEPSQGVFLVYDQTCVHCHPECSSTCTGIGPDQCDSCKNAMDGPYCVAECPELKYQDYDRVCQYCAPYCSGGCTGPKNTVSQDGCKSCDRIQIRGDDDNIVIEECLDPQQETCLEGYDRTFIPRSVGSPLAGKEACRWSSSVKTTAGTLLWLPLLFYILILY